MTKIVIENYEDPNLSYRERIELVTAIAKFANDTGTLREQMVELAEDITSGGDNPSQKSINKLTHFLMENGDLDEKTASAVATSLKDPDGCKFLLGDTAFNASW
ncbi:hypothetical protein [Pseudoalteromonas denitrificans]|uniref:Uncharacterized protein n=1 Tax=Pseudoalteromonas denitrificans DSM 6059 TaxID=1123010 RepID=A0A1I1TY97_9GAMM|nr:hypothetical protein [Pseudoalteromonas denitrificans]SFD63345.1 hypothetical protein SAMN02745724_05037 [Pseudoalteromonas denitrificans DSM 6059]